MGDLRPAVLTVNAILIVLSLAAIACRVGRRVFLVKSLSWHDTLITLAALCAITFSALLMVSTRFGLGLPNATVSSSNMRIINRLVMIWRMFYFLCNWAIKHSLLLFYTTLTIEKWPRRSIYAMHFIAFAFGMTCLFVTAFQCRPMHKIWDGAKVPGSCVNWQSFNYFNASFMLATDLVLYAMPLIFTWDLHVSKTQRFAVNTLFALGGLVLAASGVRVYFVNAQNTHPDFTRRIAMTTICAAIENHLAIIVACAPSIKVILLYSFPSLAIKFEKYSNPEVRTSDIETLEIPIGEEVGMSRLENLPKFIEPLSKRSTTNESSRQKGTHSRKWWRPPSSWEVNGEGRDDCVLEHTISIAG